MRKNLAERPGSYLLIVDMKTSELVVSATRESESEKRANADSDPLNESHAGPSFQTSRRRLDALAAVSSTRSLRMGDLQREYGDPQGGDNPEIRPTDHVVASADPECPIDTPSQCSNHSRCQTRVSPVPKGGLRSRELQPLSCLSGIRPERHSSLLSCAFRQLAASPSCWSRLQTS